MTLNHQRPRTQLVLAAVKYLKSSMCFRALINQSVAETKLKIKNIQRVQGRVISDRALPFVQVPHVTQTFPRQQPGAPSA